MARTGVNGGTGPTALDGIPSGQPVVPGPINPGNQCVRAFESCANDFDPNVSPGLDRPIGSRLIRRNGLAAWDKIGPQPTDWSPVGTGSGGGFVPSDISGLVLDLNPEIGVTVNGSNEVQAWADQGTGANDLVLDSTTAHGEPFTLVPAAIGGLPGLVSDPTLGSSLVSATGKAVFVPDSSRTIFVVATPLQVDNGCIFLGFQPAGGVKRNFTVGLWNFGNIGVVYPYTDGLTISQATPLGPGVFENETKVFAFRFTAGSTHIEWSVNGAPFVALTGLDYIGEDGFDGYFVGRFIGASFQGCFKGTLGRMLGYDSALSDDDAIRVISYLLDGYGIQGSIVAADISDSTAAGRAMLTAADAAAQRALLSIEDIGDLRNYAIARAKALLGLTSPPTVVVDEPFVLPTGAAGSFFTSGASTNVAALNGGWKQITTSATPGNAVNLVNGAFGQVVGNVGAQKWYQLWLFKLDSAADSTAQVQLGWINTAFSLDEPCVGIQGPASTTKFRAFDGAAGVTSAVDLDQAVGIIEHWGDGAGNVYAAVNGESGKTYATAKTQAVTPFVQAVAGSGGAQAVSLGHLICITPQS